MVVGKNRKWSAKSVGYVCSVNGELRRLSAFGVAELGSLETAVRLAAAAAGPARRLAAPRRYAAQCMHFGIFSLGNLES